MERLRTRRTKNLCGINARVGFRLLPLLRVISAKVRRFGSKTTQIQRVTSSVLNPRSREVWRQTAGENEFRVSAGASQCGGLRVKPVVIGLLCALASQRRMLGAEGLAEREGFERPVRFCLSRDYR